MSSEDHLRELEEKYEDYKVYDRNGERIGKVDDLFIDETDREEYIGVKMGFFGFRSTLIPMEIARVNEADRRIEVSETKAVVKDAPTFSDDDEIDASFEENIRRHFKLDSGGSTGGRGAYGRYAGSGGSSETTTDQSRGGAEEQVGGPADESDSRESHASESMQREDPASSDTAPSDTTSSGSGRDTYATERDREASRGAAEQFGEPVGDPDGGEFRDMQEMQRADVQGGRPEAAEENTSEEPSREEEGGRPKVRRRIVTEEIFEEEPPESRR